MEDRQLSEKSNTKEKSEYTAKRQRYYSPYDPVIKTQLQFTDDANINTIIDRYQITGLLPTTSTKGYYADVSNIPDYQSALATIKLAKEAFQSLPSDTRNEFKNDPANMLQFISDPKNKDRAIDLGLITGTKTPEKIIEKIIEKPTTT